MSFHLAELSDDLLDDILSMSVEQKVAYFSEMVSTFFPKVNEEDEEYQNLIESYASSFYVEKLLRTNRFFYEKFTPVYTSKGLIRNIVLDLYYTDDELLVH